MSKPVLYTFGGSIWAAVPEIAVIELDVDVDKKVVNLIEGANFDPSFLKINPNATLPTLEAGGKVYTNTTDVVSYLIKNSSVQVKAGSDIIPLIHEDKYDPNFAFLLARNEDELKGKAASVPGLYLRNRQKELEKVAPTDAAAPFKAFYDAKIAGNGKINDIYTQKVTADVKASFFEHSKAHWTNIKSFIFEILPGYLPESGFIGGHKPGEDDFHIAAWLARIAGLSGGTIGKDGVQVLEKEYGSPVPVKVASYWAAWSERDSFKATYSEGLH